MNPNDDDNGRGTSRRNFWSLDELEKKMLLSDMLFTHSSEMICLAGYDGYFKMLSPSWSKILGWTNDELLAKPWIDFVHPEDKECTLKVEARLIDGEEINQFENRYLCKDGSCKWLSWNSFPYPSEKIFFGVAREVSEKKSAESTIFNNEHKLREQVEEFVALNEELTQANQELKRLTEELSEINQRNSALLAANPDLMFVYSRKGVFLDFHTQSSKFLALNPSEFLNKTAFEVLPKSLAELNQGVIDRLFETDEVQVFTYSLEFNNVLHHYDARMVKYGKDKALAIVRDITEKKKSEEQIRQLASMVDLAPNAIIVHDFEGNPLYTNQRNLDLHGYSREEWMSLSLKQIDLPISKELFGTRIEQIKEKGEAYFEVEHYKQDGSIIPMDNYAKLVEWNGNTVLLSIGTDISDRKRYEKQLVESEKRYRELYESTPAMLHSINEKGELVSVSNLWLSKMGYAREEVIGKKSIEFLTPDSQKVALECNLPMFFQKGVMLDTPYQMVTKEGRVIDVLMSAIAEKDANNKFIRSLAVIEDVTDRMRIEKSLRESEERFRNMFEIHNAVMLLIEPDTGRISQANRAAADFYGYSQETLCAMSIQDINQLPAEEVGKLRQLAKKQNKNYFIFPHKLASGEIRTVEVHSSPIDADGKHYLFSIIHDVTERENYSDAIKRSEERVKSILRVAPVGIAVLKNRVIQEINSAITVITGYNEDELVGSSASLVYNSDSEYESAGLNVYSDIESAGIGSFETIWKHKSGRLVDVLITGTSIIPNKISEGVIFVVKDITERKLQARLVQSRLNLMEISSNCSLPELLRQTLAVAEDLTNSQIGFYHFIDEKKGEIVLNEWSLRTKKEFCNVKNGFSMHYPIDEAGMWVDCIKSRKAEVYNDYGSVPNKKGIPDGHAEIIRFISVPVVRKKKVVAILGIGNKPTDYSSTDVDIIAQLADLAWDIAEKKIADEALLHSEEQFRLLFDNMTQGFALHEIIQNEKGEVIDYKYLDVNPAFESLTGLRRDYVIGKTVLEILPDTEKFWIDIYGKVALKGEDVKFENYSREIGKYFEVSAFSPKKGQFAVIFTDVTQRRQADEKIKLLSKGLEQSPAIVIITNAKGDIEYVNPTFSKITGFSLQEVIGKNPKILKSGNQDEEFYKNLWATIIRGEDWSGEMLNKKKNGVYYWESALISPIKDEDGQILHFMAIKEDITDRKRAEKALMQSEAMLKEKNEELTIAWRKAEESDKLKTAFLANMSHEIRTPMNAIIGFSEVLLRPNLSPEKYKYFGGIINDACMQLLSVVNDVIDIAKIETNQISLFEDNVNVNEAFKRVASIFGRSVEKKSNTVLFDLPLPDEFAFIRTDEAKFTQIISNLISNAIKFTENGEITVGYKIVNNSIDCFVRDTGIGISKENHQIIFERFRQVETSDSRKYGGTGLGLSISKAFVELMGGEIWVESELDKGSEFHFTMPLKTIIKNIERVSPAIEESYSFSGKTILIAEDEPANYTLLHGWLEDYDVVILHAKDGAEALEILKINANVDLVIMDIKMPVLDGIEATKQIRKFNTRIPIVALTAYALSGDKDKCIAAGCNNYLSKPLRLNDLMRVIRDYLIDNRSE